MSKLDKWKTTMLLKYALIHPDAEVPFPFRGACGSWAVTDAARRVKQDIEEQGDDFS